MKTQTIYFSESLTRKEIENLTKEVKEMLDYEIKKTCSKKFRAVDLWNIHSNKKRINNRKFL